MWKEEFTSTLAGVSSLNAEGLEGETPSSDTKQEWKEFKTDM